MQDFICTLFKIFGRGHKKIKEVGFEVLTAVSMKIAVFSIIRAIALMMEAARTSETLVNFYQTTRCYNPEDSNLQDKKRFWALQRRTILLINYDVQNYLLNCQTTILEGLRRTVDNVVKMSRQLETPGHRDRVVPEKLGFLFLHKDKMDAAPCWQNES
jgi:hypothetical protein